VTNCFRETVEPRWQSARSILGTPSTGTQDREQTNLLAKGDRHGANKNEIAIFVFSVTTKGFSHCSWMEKGAILFASEAWPARWSASIRFSECGHLESFIRESKT
jgi:hypothetical protein